MIEHDLYFISMAARLLDMHPQTLRKYERLGLVRPDAARSAACACIRTMSWIGCA